jgi:ADP-ribose pyrophosphatase
MMLPDESTIAYKRVELGNFCSVLPLVKNRKIAMIDIYRYPADSVSREIPSGFIEKNEDPRAAALRELKEETGYIARTLRNWGWFYPWTRSTQKAYLFLAEDVVKGRSMPDRAEQIRVKLFTVDEAKKMLALGKITHPPTIIALQKLLLQTK